MTARPPASGAHAVRTAVGETVVRFELVLRINTLAHETIEHEALVHAILAGRLALPGAEHGSADRRGAGEHETDLSFCRRLIGLRARELRAAETTRTKAEARYLEGHPALFPAGLRAWDEQRRRTEELAALADRLAKLDGANPLDGSNDAEAFDARVAELVADLIEPARVTTLEQLGEGARAQALAVRWVRPKLVAGPVPDAAPVGLGADGEGVSPMDAAGPLPTR